MGIKQDKIKFKLKQLKIEKKQLKKELKALRVEQYRPINWDNVKFGAVVYFKNERPYGRFVCLEGGLVVWRSVRDGIMSSNPENMLLKDATVIHDFDYGDGITF